MWNFKPPSTHPTPHLPKRQEGLKIRVNNQSCLCDEASIKISKYKVQRTLGWWTHPQSRRVAHPNSTQTEAPGQDPPRALLMYLFIRLFVPFII